MSLLSPSLIAFLAVVRKSTVLDAAKDLNLTQTAVTQRIKILEAQLGVTLFLRSRRGMLLTSDGEALLHFCKASRELEGITLSRLGKNGKLASVNISLAAKSNLMHSRVLPKLAELNQRLPDMKLNLINLDDGDPIDRLKSGEADIVFTAPSSVGREMDSSFLSAEKYALVAAKNLKKIRLEEFIQTHTMIEFDKNDQLCWEFLKKHKLSKYASSERHFAGNSANLLAMLKAGYGYSVLSAETLRQALKEKNLVNLSPDKNLERPLALAWYPRPVMPDHFRAIIEILKR